MTSQFYVIMEPFVLVVFVVIDYCYVSLEGFHLQVASQPFDFIVVEYIAQQNSPEFIIVHGVRLNCLPVRECDWTSHNSLPMALLFVNREGKAPSVFGHLLVCIYLWLAVPP